MIEGVSFGRRETITFVGALRVPDFTAPLTVDGLTVDGLTVDGLTVDGLTVDGPFNGCIFLAWVRQHLVLTLAHGDIVVMDHLSSHKVKGVREAIESVGTEVRYLPTCSPNMNRTSPQTLLKR